MRKTWRHWKEETISAEAQPEARNAAGREKRRGWNKEFLESLTAAAKDIAEISEERLLRTVRTYRKKTRVTKITV